MVSFLRISSMLFGLLFGGVFSGVGIFISIQTWVPMLQNYYEVQDWQPIPARLLTIRGGNSETTATYTYTYQGKVYHNDRVYLAEFNDNIGDYHSRLQSRLRQILASDSQTVKVHVDPDNPVFSVLDPTMRWGLFSLIIGFTAVFICIGLFVIWSGMFIKPKKRINPLPKVAELREEWKTTEADEKESFISFLQKRKSQVIEQEQISTGNTKREIHSDWKKRKGWEKEKIRSDAKSGALGIWLFTLIWNGISYTVAVSLLLDWNRRDWEALIVLLFPVVGLILFFQAIKKTLEFRKFGVIEYTMDPYPGSIGGNVGGNLTLYNWKNWEADYTVLLECVYSYVSGSGKNRSRIERIEWAEEGIAKAVLIPNGIQLEFAFTVPGNLPEAEIEQTGNYYFWKLSVRADLPGIDLNRSYNIPVFSTGESTAGTYHDISKQAVRNNERENERTHYAIERGRFDETALHKSMRMKDLGRGLLLIFPMFRSKLITIIALVFGGGFSFATYSVISSFSGSGFFSIFAYLFTIPFAIVGFLGSVIGLYLPFDNLRVWFENKEVIVLRRWLFIPVYYKKVAAHEITSLHLKRKGSTGQGTKKVEHFKILANLQDGGTMTIAEDINGKNLAEQLKNYLMRRIQSC